MAFRRWFLAALLVPIVLTTAVATAVHAHLPSLESTTGVVSDASSVEHDLGSCPICRLAHETSPGAIHPADVLVAAASPIERPAEPIRLLGLDLEPVHSPRAPPRPALS